MLLKPKFRLLRVWLEVKASASFTVPWFRTWLLLKFSTSRVLFALSASDSFSLLFTPIPVLVRFKSLMPTFSLIPAAMQLTPFVNKLLSARSNLVSDVLTHSTSPRPLAPSASMPQQSIKSSFSTELLLSASARCRAPLLPIGLRARSKNTSKWLSFKLDEILEIPVLLRQFCARVSFRRRQLWSPMTLAKAPATSFPTLLSLKCNHSKLG
mmetsp:Transcript_16989/g.31781  ORF Transcript_16989/g.31781 Transcript_16989/m.31781 type:complete len:211 (-) Transcript_16989:405-1037(-)